MSDVCLGSVCGVVLLADGERALLQVLQVAQGGLACGGRKIGFISMLAVLFADEAGCEVMVALLDELLVGGAL